MDRVFLLQLFTDYEILYFFYNFIHYNYEMNSNNKTELLKMTQTIISENMTKQIQYIKNAYGERVLGYPDTEEEEEEEIILESTTSTIAYYKDLFYIFTCIGDDEKPYNIHKFGMSNKKSKKTKDGKSKRLNQYSGCNIPKTVYTEYYVNDGHLWEHYMKEFLIHKNIPIVYGNEFFKYKGNMKELVAEFFDYDKSKCMEKEERSKKTNVDKQKGRSGRNRKDVQEKGKMYRCLLCNYETKVKGNIDKKSAHRKTPKHKGAIIKYKLAIIKWKIMMKKNRKRPYKTMLGQLDDIVDIQKRKRQKLEVKNVLMDIVDKVVEDDDPDMSMD